MKLDTETLRPVIIAMAIYLAMSKFLPSLSSTGVKPIDDMTAFFIVNKGDVMTGLIIVAFVVLATLKIDQTL